MSDKDKFDKFRRFICDNHSIVNEYYLCYLKRYIEKDWKEQLRILFINTLNAGGVGKISKKAKAIDDLDKKIDTMKKPTYAELQRAFEADSYDNLFNSLKRLDQIGPKKSALFLRDILYFENPNIISNVPSELKKQFYVPVDVVIVRTVNSIFNEDYRPNTDNAFKRINELAGEIFPEEPIFLEDLWFWGRFYRCKENNDKEIPYCKFNRDLLIVDTNATRGYRNKLLKFAEKQCECPFKDICAKAKNL